MATILFPDGGQCLGCERVFSPTEQREYGFGTGDQPETCPTCGGRITDLEADRRLGSLLIFKDGTSIEAARIALDSIAHLLEYPTPVMSYECGDGPVWYIP
jgi:hypothetical protein